MRIRVKHENVHAVQRCTRIARLSPLSRATKLVYIVVPIYSGGSTDGRIIILSSKSERFTYFFYLIFMFIKSLSLFTRAFRFLPIGRRILSRVSREGAKVVGAMFLGPTATVLRIHIMIL